MGYLNEDGLTTLVGKIKGQVVQLTSAEYRLLPESKNSDNKIYFVTDEDYAYAIDDEPTLNSDNLVKSGGVYNYTSKIGSGTLTTTAQTIIPAVNELKAGLTAINNGQLSKYLIIVQNDMANIISTYGNGAYVAWGTFGGIFAGWAWGLLIIMDGVANFIGVRNAAKTIAAAHYENGAWTKITSVDS